MRRLFLVFFLVVMPCGPSLGEEVQLAKVKATLKFREVSEPSAHYPHLLRVYLCLENQHDSDVTWVCNSIENVEAELLDAQGQPARQPPSFASITSNAYAYMLPYGSRLEWMLSHGGVSMVHRDRDEVCALIVGGEGWLLPRDSLSSYSLRLRVRGWPWTRHETVDRRGGEKLLFEVPATPIVITTATDETRIPDACRHGENKGDGHQMRVTWEVYRHRPFPYSPDLVNGTFSSLDCLCLC